MKKRFVAMILITAVLLSVFNFSLNAHAETTSSQSLGSITDCTVDSNRDTIIIRGSVKHSVLIGNRGSRIAVYRFDPWTDVTSAIATAKPEAVTDMSISFDFELPCSTVLQTTSLYAVALINAGGKPLIISSPTYPDVSVKDTSDAGFKTILSSDHAAALQVLPGSAIVDVYLDKLNNGNNSGYIYNADGDLFYFDKTEINGLDRAIRSYTASGTKVYMRFLISPSVTDLAFCSDASTWAANKCVVVDDADALRSIYAYTAFLISRYSGGDYGCVDGIILGRGADMPVLNNYAFLVSENYNTVYARSLTLIGLAAAQSTDDKIALLVPIGDELTSNNRVNGEEFLYAVADYVETYSNLSFTVLCESRHNPYGISDAIFSTNDESEITDEFTETTEIEFTQNCETDSVTEYISDVEASEAMQTQEVSAEADMTLTDPQDILTEPASPSVESVSMESLSPEEGTSPQDRLQPNKNSQGYFCTDNIEAFQQMFSRLKKKHTSVNKAFAWCWYPDTDTAESALGVCYAYNYMKLAAMDADFYAVGFENELVDRFQSVSHLLKYIDTSSNVSETAYARNVFGIESWKELISKWNDGCGVYSSLWENELQPGVSDYSGELVYLDYTSGKGAVDWYNGHYCSSTSLQNTDGQGFLKVTITLEGSGFVPAEIGYLLDRPEPLLVGDLLTFDVKCGEEDGSLYEISIYVNHGEGTLISKCVVAGGVKCSLSADVSEFDNTTLVNSIRISVKRVTGDGAFDLELYRVSINDYTDSSALLAQKLEDVRNYLRTDTRDEDTSSHSRIAIGALLLTAVGVTLFLWAYGNDRKYNDDTK